MNGIKEILSPVCFKSKDCAYWKAKTKFPRRCKECEQKAAQIQALIDKERAEIFKEIEESSTRDDEAGWLDFTGDWPALKSKYLP